MRGNTLLLSMVGLVFAGIAAASPACTTNTFQYYMTHPCSIGVVDFDFSAAGAYLFTPDDYNPLANNVTVTPVGTGLLPNDPVGFTFSANNFVTNANNGNEFGGNPTCCKAGSAANPAGTGWLATNPDNSGNFNYANLDITFSAAINSLGPSDLLYSSTTTLDVFIYSPHGNSFISSAESITDTNTNMGLGGISLLAKGNNDSQSESFGGSALSASHSFTGTTGVGVTKDLLISSTFAANPPQSVALNGLTETFKFYDTTVPEPGSFLLVGMTMLVACVCCRKTRLARFLGSRRAQTEGSK